MDIHDRYDALAEKTSRLEQALRDIATSEPIPTPGEAHVWCKQAATAALDPK